jgi:AcrR family transcriptional regulator
MGSPRVEHDPASAPKRPVRPPPKKVTAGKAAPRAVLAPAEIPLGDADAVGAPASKRVLRSQGRRTMRKLLDAAMVAFDKRGYHATRVNDVVEIAKTSHGTFYLYFSNKEDLLRALVAEAAGEAQTLYDALSTLPAQAGAPRWEDVHAWVRAYSVRAALPSLDRSGHDRPGPRRRDPRHLHCHVGCAGHADRT